MSATNGYHGRLLNLDANPKTVKGQKRGYKTAVLYLAPANLSGFNVCPMATNGCTAACLNTAGRGGLFQSVQKSRIAKTRFFFEHREAFLTQLVKELSRFITKTRQEGFEPVVRLNGTSDILWERLRIPALAWKVSGIAMGAPNIMALFPDVQFYDYTKHWPNKRANLPHNYALTYSLNEAPDSETHAVEALQAGWNVAVVFRKPPFPLTYRLGDYTAWVVDGDKDDLRFLDQQGVVVALKAKGKAKKDTSGFVRDCGESK
jgi:hypothetical protein